MAKDHNKLSYSENTMIEMTNHNGHKRLHQMQKKRVEPQNNQELLKFSFQAKIDANSISTTAGSEPREIQNNN